MKINILKSLSNDVKRGLGNSIYLTIANILSVFITFIGFIYIPNRLGSHDYGLYSLALSFVALFDIFGFYGLAKVIIRETIIDKKSLEKIINNLFNFKLFLSLLQIVAVVTVAFFSYELEVFIIIIIASNMILFEGLESIPSAVIQADEKIKTLARIEVAHSLIRIFGIVVILFFIKNLIFVMIYMAVVNFIFIYIYYRVMNRIITYKLSLNFKKIAIPMKFFKQGLIFSLMSIGGVLSTKIDVFMLSYMSSLEDVAVYGLSEKIVLQFTILRGVILTAFYPIVIKHFQKNRVELKTIYLITAGIFIATTLLGLIYSIFAEDMITLLYSSEYIGAVEVSIILFFYLAFHFSGLPFTVAMEATKLERYVLYMYPFSLTINIALNYILFHKMGIVGLAYSTLIVQIFMLLFLITVGSHQLKKRGFIKK